MKKREKQHGQNRPVVKLSLPVVSEVPPDLAKSHLFPLKEWLKLLWLRRQRPSQLQIDDMTELAIHLCMRNYSEQFRSMVLRQHEDSFRILSAGAHHEWRHLTQNSSQSNSRALLSFARREYVNALHLLEVVNEITSFHDCNEPRLSLAVQLVKRLKFHLLEKNSTIFEALTLILGPYQNEKGKTPALPWEECFPNPNDRPTRLQAAKPRIVYKSSGMRHWEQEQSQSKEVLLKSTQSLQKSINQNRQMQKKGDKTIQGHF